MKSAPLQKDELRSPCKPKKKKKKNITDRKTFATYCGKKDAKWFSNVIWSDES